ncbi:putative G-patch domain protein [Aspergillus ibericus CBS 121593]|uniref:Rna-binding protein n=1 Tax=Aspergillus ibericus CBS 121593 TaxID=1448316 RepID=A0A395H4R1_9EURO|nr:rna-binding protein [Aspergillus ibericus CBS 121593]RAL02837.1 rna-binding protein [Aspergillus ibericus CBS 121593]
MVYRWIWWKKTFDSSFPGSLLPLLMAKAENMSPGSGRRGYRLRMNLKIIIISKAWMTSGSFGTGRRVGAYILCVALLMSAELSRQLGFLRFRSLNFSRAFLERNFPTIYLHGPSAQNDRGTKVRIAYSREREDRARARAEADWNCVMCGIVNYSTRQKCFRCQGPRPDAGPAGPPGLPAPKVENHGDNDAAPENQASQFLLFRGLEPSVTEELLAKGVAKLYRPTSSADAPGTGKKGAKVASTTGDSNLGARDGSIRRVLLVRDRRTNDSWRYGFAEFATIQDAQAAVTRLNSFEKFTISSRPVLVSYIHAGVFVPVLNPTASTERFTFSPLSSPALKLMYWDEEAYVTELTVSTADLDNPKDKPAQPESKSKEAEKAKKRKAEAASAAGAKKMAVPSHLQFWSNRHAELHGIQKKDADDKSTEHGSDRGASPSDAAPPTQSYADPNRNCCYLCMRQFKSSAEVNRHERLSQLHRGNLQNEELTAKAMGKLIKHGIIAAPTEYRDRARERRKAFGSSKPAAKPAAKNRPAPASAPQEEEPVQTTSKGASLLSKMGWTGAGLGAQGTGMTAPIATEVYAQGVGLGAQGGKLGDATEEAGRNTRNRYEEFLAKTKQQARERYEQMDR